MSYLIPNIVMYALSKARAFTGQTFESIMELMKGCDENNNHLAPLDSRVSTFNQLVVRKPTFAECGK